MSIVLKNNAHTTLSANITSLDTTIYVDDVDSFPSLGVGEYFYCTLENTNGNYEIVKVTQVNNTNFIVVRAQEDTIAIPFNIGARVELRVTVQALEDHFTVAAATEIANQIGVTIQAYDADLTTWAALTPSANAQSLVTAANYAAMRAQLDLEPGTDFVALTGGTYTGDISVPDEAYNVGWNGSVEVPTKNAVYDKISTIDTLLSALETSVTLQGTWDASAGTFPGGGTAQAGHSYIVSVGGTVDSVAFVAGDRVIAITDNASTTTYASNWFKADYTDAVSSVAGKTGAVTLQVADITDMTANGRSLVSAADYAAMKALLDLEIGTDVQAYDADLTTWAGLTPSANAQSLVTAANYAAMRTLLDLEAGVDFVGIGGGTYTGDISVPDEVYDATAWNGSVEVPTKNAVRDKIASLAQADISGLTTASSPQFTAIELGHASDTTIARSSAGVVTIEGNVIYRASGTDVTLADGGTGASLTDPNADRIMFWDDSAGAVTWLAPDGFSTIIDTTTLYSPETWAVAASDESTALTTGTNKATFVFPYNVTVLSVGASVNTAGTALTVDINESGTSILSTKITLDSGEKTSLTAATAPVISDSAIAAGNEIGIDIDTVTGTAKGLKVWMIVRRTS